MESYNITFNTDGAVTMTENFDGVLRQGAKLKAVWCECGNEEFHSYPEDGECACGMIKHHVHCTCGGVTQTG